MICTGRLWIDVGNDHPRRIRVFVGIHVEIDRLPALLHLTVRPAAHRSGHAAVTGSLGAYPGNVCVRRRIQAKKFTTAFAKVFLGRLLELRPVLCRAQLVGTLIARESKQQWHVVLLAVGKRLARLLRREARVDVGAEAHGAGGAAQLKLGLGREDAIRGNISQSCQRVDAQHLLQLES